MWLAVQSEKLTQAELARYIQSTLRGQFSTISGLGDIRLGGYQEPNLRVWVDPSKLRSYELTISDIADTIRTEHLEPPAGTLTFQGEEVGVRALGEAESVEEFEKLRITQRGGAPNYAPISLSAFARIEEGTEDVRRIARANGTPAMGLGIQKQRGATERSRLKDPRTAEKMGDDEDNTEVGQSIDVSTATSRSFLTSTRLSDRSKREFQSSLSPTIKLTYSQAWTPLFSTHLGYRFEYLNYSSPSVAQDSYILHQFSLGESYRFGGGHNLFLTFLGGEDFFTKGFGPQTQSLTPVWIPKLSFGTRSRVYATGFGDFGLSGSLSALFRGSNDDTKAFTGFKQTVGAIFSRPVATADLLQFIARADRLD